MNEIDEMTAKEKEMYETPDQWKSYGNCEKCRKQKYCKTECSAHRRAMSYWIQNEIVRRLMTRRGKYGAQKQPTVDAVPVVRCGECKYFIENTWECVRLSDRFGDEYSDARVYPEYYCADGERKEKDDATN